MLSNRAHTTSRPEAPELHQIKVKSTPLAAEMPKLHCPRGIAFNWRILESTGEAIFPAVGLSLRRAPMASGAREACQPMCAASYGRGSSARRGLKSSPARVSALALSDLFLQFGYMYLANRPVCGIRYESLPVVLLGSQPWAASLGSGDTNSDREVADCSS